MSNNKPIAESIAEYAQGIVGGLLFSFPLLFTMEVWYAGFLAQPFQLLIMVVATFLLLLGYNRYAGMHAGTSWKDVVIDSFEEMGIGLVMSFLILLMLNRIQLMDNSLDEIMGKVITEAMFVSIGVSVGTAQLGNSAKEEDELAEEEDQQHTTAVKRGEKRRSTKFALVVLALCGSVIVGGSVAPTEEVLLLAAEAKPIHILFIALVSILLSTVVCYFSDFKGTDKPNGEPKLYDIVFETCLSYSTALIASAFILWYFVGFGGNGLWIITSQCIVLGLLASLGASAGRLLIK
ncbi:MAG TPA: TIGR02587 family membrane protein [Cyclobacteriaceae bacterium]|nr:TIGR02587 family membrane protein [Cyclobacteriaceae bacterium]